MKTFRNFMETLLAGAAGSLVEARAPHIGEYSWTWHPHHGIRIETGYHRHESIEDNSPEVREDPDDPSHGWEPPAGFAKVDRAKREIEFYDYTSGKVHPEAAEAFKHELGLKNYRVVSARQDTLNRRKEEDWI